MITNNEAYFLGLMYAKGDILTDDKNVRFRINIKYRRPDDEALRKDNIYTKLKKKTSGKEKVGSRFYDDVIKLKSMLDKTFDINFDLMLDNATGSSWSKKDISLTSEKVPDNDARFAKLFLTDKITAKTLQTFPFALQIHTSRAASLNFVQGVCDACSLVPNEASSQNGGEGSPRIQLEPSQERWELCIALCEVFQLGLGIRVNNINWGHPQIRKIWRGQNHQFRVRLSEIPKEVELYKLEYKRREYHDLYERTGMVYAPTKELCPEKKKTLRKGMRVDLASSASEELCSGLLHEKLRGISVDVPNKKSVIICKLLGCKRCQNFFTLTLDGKEIDGKR